MLLPEVLDVNYYQKKDLWWINLYVLPNTEVTFCMLTSCSTVVRKHMSIPFQILIYGSWKWMQQVKLRKLSWWYINYTMIFCQLIHKCPYNLFFAPHFYNETYSWIRLWTFYPSPRETVHDSAWLCMTAKAVDFFLLCIFLSTCNVAKRNIYGWFSK